MGDWWQREIVDPGKQPLLLCSVAFVVTFAVTRIIVRSIRAGKGSLKDNVVGGVHIHHVVPGIILMTVFGLMGLGAQSTGWQSVAGIGFGAGLALVLDEFALILHLEDVYWSNEGRTSVDAVFLTAGVMFLVLVGSSPMDDSGTDGTAGRIGLFVALAVNLAAVGVTFAKGKLGTGVIGLVVPAVAWTGAVRLARPTSPWAHWRYAGKPRKQERAAARDERFDARWRTRLRRFQDKVAGFTN
jgi:hypothetical protein